MSKLIKTSPKLCKSCIYHMAFGSQPGKIEENCRNVACNYLGIVGYSRIFKDGCLQHDPDYCDKYEQGEEITNAWTTDNMTIWVEENEKRRLWKELEDARF